MSNGTVPAVARSLTGLPPRLRRGRFPKVEVLIFTIQDTDTLVRDAVEAGTRGSLLKSGEG